MVARANSAELQFVRDLVSEARTQRESWARTWSDAALESEFESAALFVANDKSGAFAGFALVRAPGNMWEVMLLAVSPPHRRTGTVRRLIAAIDEHRSAGLSNASKLPLALEVRADNLAAIGAYEKLGFKKVGRRTGYYDDGVEAILYRLE